MKNILLFLIAFTALPIISGYNCRTNIGNPNKPDYKTRHAIKCECNCTNKNRICPECGHDQEARPQIIIESTKNISHLNKKPTQMTPYQALTLCVKKYKKNNNR